jgi:hypothetical protein
MDAPSLLALAGIIAAAGINIGGCLVAWGALKGAVAAVQLKDLTAQIRDAQIRWLREPRNAPAPSGRRAGRSAATLAERP